MSPALRRALLASLLLSSTLAACTDDDAPPVDPEPAPLSPPAHFGTLTDAQRGRAVTASSGSDALDAVARGASLSGLAEHLACPQIQRTADHVAVSTNCRIGQIDYTGGYTLKYPGGQDIEIEFTKFGIKGEGQDLLLDGKVASRTGMFESDLVTTRHGIAVLARGTWTVDRGTITAGPDTVIDLYAGGSAEVHGSWNLDRMSRAGSIELKGADVLTGTVGPTCLDLTIGTQAVGRVCGDLLQ